MSTESLIEILRAHLAKEGLVFCRYADTQFALIGMKETVALQELAELVKDALSVGPWIEDGKCNGRVTQEIPAETVQMLRALSVS